MTTVPLLESVGSTWLEGLGRQAIFGTILTNNIGLVIRLLLCKLCDQRIVCQARTPVCKWLPRAFMSRDTTKRSSTCTDSSLHGIHWGPDLETIEGQDL